MGKSPGHQKWPEHKVHEEPLEGAAEVVVDGSVIASSRDVIKLEEDHHPTRYYFPRADVQMAKLEPTSTTSECPFKGKASYFSINTGDKKLVDAVWCYEDPYEEHQDLKGRLAFYDDKIPGISIRMA